MQNANPPKRARPHRAAILAFVFAVVLAAQASLAEPMRATGTRAWLDLPAAFEPADAFTGFIAVEPRASVAVAELPAPFVDAYEAYSDDGLARKGITVTARTALELDGLRAVLVAGEQTAQKIRLRKLILLTGDLDATLTVTATYRDGDAKHYDAPLREALRNVRWEPSLPLNLYDGLGFRLTDVPGLRVATRAANNIVFTTTGRLPDPYYTGPFLAAGWSPDIPEGLDDASRFSREQFKRMGLVTTGVIDDVVYKRIKDYEAIETRGHGVHRHLGYEVSVYQIVVQFPGRFLVAQGICDRSDEKRAFDRFESVLSSLSVDSP